MPQPTDLLIDFKYIILLKACTGLLYWFKSFGFKLRRDAEAGDNMSIYTIILGRYSERVYRKCTGLEDYLNLAGS